MVLNLEQEDKLNFYIEEIEANERKLNDWERMFFNDQVKRYAEHGAKMSLSPKQWAVLDKMYKKVTGG